MHLSCPFLRARSRNRIVCVCVMLCASSLCTAYSAIAQDLAEAARQEKARKAAQQKPPAHVYTEEDLKREQIITPEDRALIEARKKNVTPPPVKEVAPANAPAPDTQEAAAPKSLGEIARRLRQEKAERLAEQARQIPQPAPFHFDLPHDAALAHPRLPVRPLLASPVAPSIHAHIAKPPVAAGSIKRDPFSRASIFVAPHIRIPANAHKAPAAPVLPSSGQASVPFEAQSKPVLPRPSLDGLFQQSVKPVVPHSSAPETPAVSALMAAPNLAIPKMAAPPALAPSKVAIAPAVAPSVKTHVVKVPAAPELDVLNACGTAAPGCASDPFTAIAAPARVPVPHELFQPVKPVVPHSSVPETPAVSAAMAVPELATPKVVTPPALPPSGVAIPPVIAPSPTATAIVEVAPVAASPLPVSPTVVPPITLHAPAAPSATPPSPDSIRVQLGDSLWNLSRQFLGKGSRWREWLTRNPSIIDPRRMKLGAVLFVPTAEPEVISIAEPPSALRPDELEAPATISVRPGDSLWRIAATYLGHGAKWLCLAQANPNLRNASRIYPGQTLTIPASCTDARSRSTKN